MLINVSIGTTISIDTVYWEYPNSIPLKYTRTILLKKRVKILKLLRYTIKEQTVLTGSMAEINLLSYRSSVISK